MKEFTAEEAQRDFGRLVRESGQEPVRVGDGPEARVVMTEAEYDVLYQARQRKVRDELRALIAETGAYAASQGLTDEVLAELLADES